MDDKQPTLPTQPTHPAGEEHTAAASQTPTPQQKQPKKKLWIIGGAIAVLLIGAAVAVGLYLHVRSTPGYLLRTATHNLANQETVAAKFRLVSGTEDNGVVFSGDIAARGDKANPKNGEFVFGMGTGDSRIGLSLRAIDNTYYMRVTQLENLATLLQSFSPDIASLYGTPQVKEVLQSVNDQWYQLDQQEAASELIGEGTGDIVSPEDMRKVWHMYQRHEFLVPGQVYADETVEGVNTAHFSIVFNKDRYVAFLQELKAANIQGMQVTDRQIEDAKAQPNPLQNSNVEVWVARDNQQFKQVRMANTAPGQAMNVTFTFVTDLPAFEPLQKPQDVQPFESLLNTFNNANRSIFLEENATGF